MFFCLFCFPNSIVVQWCAWISTNFQSYWQLSVSVLITFRDFGFVSHAAHASLTFVYKSHLNPKKKEGKQLGHFGPRVLYIIGVFSSMVFFFFSLFLQQTNFVKWVALFRTRWIFSFHFTLTQLFITNSWFSFIVPARRSTVFFYDIWYKNLPHTFKGHFRFHTTGIRVPKVFIILLFVWLFVILNNLNTPLAFVYNLFWMSLSLSKE